MKDSSLKDKKWTDIASTDIYNHVKITRDAHTKSTTLEIDIPCEWNLFAGDTVGTLDLSTAIAQGKKEGVFPISVSASQRSYFKLITNLGTAVLAEKHLPMEGGYNFRDLGGLKSKNGKRVQWGKFFRTDDLFHLTQDDLAYLSSIPITTIVDFRCKEEYTLLPDKFPESLKNYYNLSIHPGSLQNFTKSSLTSKEGVIDAMKKLYTLFVTEAEFVATYREFFSLIQNEKELPLLFHCSAGKDRTGFAAVLLLSALDIPHDTILQDYLDSNYYLGDKYKSLFEENPVNKYLYTIIPEYLETALDAINKKYGTMQKFLEKELKINTQKLKETYLY